MLEVELKAKIGAIDLDVSLSVPKDETLALVGPSGSGKTTVLRMIAGLMRPDRGRVSCGEKVWTDIAAAVNQPPEQRRCGFLFQDYALFGHFSAWRNVAYGLNDLPRGLRRARALELLESLGIGQLADALPARMSGGERQRVALARALARKPELLLLDEPLSALDASSRIAATQVLTATVADYGVPTVVVTHDFSEASLTADRIAVIDSGKIVQVGTADQLAAQPLTAFVEDFTGDTMSMHNR